MILIYNGYINDISGKNEDQLFFTLCKAEVKWVFFFYLFASYDWSVSVLISLLFNFFSFRLFSMEGGLRKVLKHNHTIRPLFLIRRYNFFIGQPIISKVKART